ncbi:hypothetical protein HUB98_28915 [Paenibacillus barcinonensis]|uniref:Uncharacterized protein n=1 Tax=Paenibacillus barcinonensis TaxID=198119 RepID=A0A2V4VKZ9_PAEBA|nr:hypothetical protein [Paenibacillus barcinonensis]PYE50095.1 hypothetical protein DFQ00_10453 [Paenibacillus barcinonensis]QKS59832.1 hypothetical protein HUB98_28915 [Paenibacillus barcinonensis]
MNRDSEYDKSTEELKPGVNTVIEPDQRNPGPTDMIEDAVGDIVDNIRQDFTRKSEDSSNKK